MSSGVWEEESGAVDPYNARPAGGYEVDASVVAWPDASGSEGGEELVIAAPTTWQGSGGARGNCREGTVAGSQWRELHAQLRREGIEGAGRRGPDEEAR